MASLLNGLFLIAAIMAIGSLGQSFAGLIASRERLRRTAGRDTAITVTWLKSIGDGPARPGKRRHRAVSRSAINRLPRRALRSDAA